MILGDLETLHPPPRWGYFCFPICEHSLPILPPPQADSEVTPSEILAAA